MHSPGTRRLQRVLRAAVFGWLGALTFAFLSSCSSGTETIVGIIVLVDGDVSGSWDDCEGTGGYSDISAGAFVAVEDENGTKLTGTSYENLSENDLELLLEHTAIGREYKTIDAVRSWLKESESAICVLKYAATVDLGGVKAVTFKTNRGEMTFSVDDLKSKNYVFSTSLGV